MRTTSIVLLASLCVCSYARAQTPADVVSPEDAAFNSLYEKLAVPKVTGKILHLSPDDLKSVDVSYTIVTPFAQLQQHKTVRPAPDGSFTLALDYPFPFQQVWVGYGDFFYAGICANQDLYIELDMEKIKAAKGVQFNGEGVRYLGTDGPLNTYLNNFILYRRNEQLELGGRVMSIMQKFGSNPDSLLQVYNRLNDSIRALGDSFIASNPSPYGWIIDNEQMSDYYGQLCIAYFGKRMPDSLWTRICRHKSYLMTNSGSTFYNYLTMYLNALPDAGGPVTWKDVAQLPDLMPDEQASIDSLRGSEKMPAPPENIKRWTRQLRPRMQSIAMNRRLAMEIHRLDSAFSPAKADFLKLRLSTSTDLVDQRAAMDHAVSSMRTSWCISVEEAERKQTTDKIEELNKALASTGGHAPHTSFGDPLIQTSFGASLYIARGKATDFLKALVQSFPGKAIIIDRWATWCGACLAEMPHSKELEGKSAGLPVVFVYLCTINGSTEDKWKSKVAELKQPGMHFLIDEAMDAEISRYFSFGGYPGYALIDKTGVYKPGAIRWMSEIGDRSALEELIK